MEDVVRREINMLRHEFGEFEFIHLLDSIIR